MAIVENPSAYIPMDRRQAMLGGDSLPEYQQGSALFADISGFTPLTERLVNELGHRRGAEELTYHLNIVYDALITELHKYGGSVITFSGDAITCWINGDAGFRATACALAMQQVMKQFASVATPSGQSVSLAMKTAVAAGTVRRFIAGDPEIQLIDVMAGRTLDRLAAAEHLADRGEVVIGPEVSKALGDQLQISGWRQDVDDGNRYAVVTGFAESPELTPWPSLPPTAFDEEIVRPWLLPAVYDRLHGGRGEFLAELRPAVSLFLRFQGIDYDHDAEAVDELNVFVRGIQHILNRYDANLTQLTFGDKGSYCSIAFGAPLAHEDDAVRAAAAALELRDLGQGLEYITSVQIGISQGRMRTGAYGGAQRRTYSLMGDEVNLSARLMQAAESGQILVGETTQQAAAAEFVWESLPEITVKGKAEPITIFSLLGSQRRQTNRLQAPTYALPMVGREAELALFRQKIEPVLQGIGQVVAVEAEAGMGKTRLVAEVIGYAGEMEMEGYGGECQSYGTTTSYLVWQDIWQAFFNLDLSLPLDLQVASLEAQLGLIDPSLVPRAPLLSAVLNLPISDNELTRSLDAKLRKTALESLLVDCLRARAKESSLLFVLEDTHWMDPLSQELLEVVAQAIAELPVMLVMASRPPDRPSSVASTIAQLSYYTEIKLNDFTPQESRRLIDLKLAQFMGPEMEAPQDLVERVTDRAQGNPFYIEELLNFLRDQGIDPRDSRALAQLDLPTSLHSLILSRIDQRTESQKSTLKVASVIGRTFRADMLWGVYPELGEPPVIQADLDVLCELDLIPIDTPEPELSYLFKHIVTREVAYESLPYATRASLHDLIGRFIEKTYADNLKPYVDLLAYHFEHSENEPKKREYLLKAGEVAQADYANSVAMDYYRRVLPLLPEEEKVAVLLKLGAVLETVGEWEQADATYRRAIELADALGMHTDRAWCQAALAELLRKQGAYAEASDWLNQAQAAFEAEDVQAGVALVFHRAGSVAAQQGNYEESRGLYQQSLAIRRQLDDKASIGDLLSNMAIVARFQGDTTLSQAFNEEALEIRREAGDKRPIGISLNNLGNVALDQGEYAEARAYFEEGLELMRQIGERQLIATNLNNLANAIRNLGDYEAAAERYGESIYIYREVADKWGLAYLLEDIGALAALTSRPQAALKLVGAAAELRQEIGSPLSPAETTKLEKWLEPARHSLSETEQTAAIADGKRLALEQALDYALDILRN